MSECLILFPGCKTGYGSSKVPPGISTHIFPKDQSRREKWIRAIPRKNWEPGKKAVVCSLHFQISDFKTESQDSNKGRNKVDLKRKILKHDAVPTNFPNLPAYLSRKENLQRSSNATVSARLDKAAAKLTLETEVFLAADKVSKFDQIQMGVVSQFPPTWNVISLRNDDQILFDRISFDDGGKAKFRFTLTIKKNLEFLMFCNESPVPASRVSHITKSKNIQRLSDIHNLLAFLNSSSDISPESETVVNECEIRLAKVLEGENDDSKRKKLTFVVEQLRLLRKTTKSRRYSSGFLWSALTWMKTSPALYNLMTEDGFFTLPSSSYLKRLSGAFSLESGLSESTLAYLNERIKSLSECEKTIAIAIDEVNYSHFFTFLIIKIVCAILSQYFCSTKVTQNRSKFKTKS